MQIYNFDESGLDPQGGTCVKVIARRGAKAVYQKRGQSRETTSVLLAVSATGAVVPPLFIFKGKRFSSDLLRDAPPGSVGTATENAFIDIATFKAWVEHFVRHIPPARPVLLVLDNHVSHVALEVLEECIKHGIDVLSLPPHTTHLLQPLDDGCFRSIKAQWRKEIYEWACSTNGANIPRNRIAQLFGATMEKAWAPGIVVGSWKSTGLWPIDPSKALSKEAPSSNIASPNKFAAFEVIEDSLPLSSIKPRDLRRVEREGIDQNAFHAFSIVKRTVGVSPLKTARDRVLIDLKDKRILTDDDAMAERRLQRREREEEERERKEKKEEAARRKLEREHQKAKTKQQNEEKRRAREAAKIEKELELVERRRKRAERAAEKIEKQKKPKRDSKQTAKSLQKPHEKDKSSTTTTPMEASMTALESPNIALQPLAELGAHVVIQRTLFTVGEFVDL